jgi:hypothetical protein
MFRWTRLASVLCVILATWPGPVSSSATSKVITGGTLIDGTGRPVLTDAAIVIEGGKIISIGKKGEATYPKDVEVIKADGKFILPGLIDAHVHYWEYLPEIWATYGITTVVDTGNYMDYILAVREATAAGKLWGPRVVAAGSAIAGPGGAFRDMMVVNNPAEARAAADEHVRKGVNFIKVFPGITVDQLAAITEVTRRAGTVVGHLQEIDAREAALAGISGLIHAGGVSAALAPAPLAAVIKKTPSGGGLFHHGTDPAKFDELARFLVERRIMIEPDLVASMKGILKQWDRFDLENRRLFDDPNLSYVQLEDQQRWFKSASWTPEELEQKREGYRKMADFLGKFVKAGGLLLAGSDEVGTGTPGTTLHQELEVYVEDVGLSPMQAIQTVTKNVAVFYNLPNLGTLEPGKFADLIVLREDPLQDIRNTRSVDLVMKNGEIMPTGFHAGYSNPYRRPFRENPPVGGNPVLAIQSVVPYVVTQGEKSALLTIKGSGFVPNSIVWFGDWALKTTFVSTGELRAELTEEPLQGVGTVPVRVSIPVRAMTRRAATSDPVFVLVKHRQ